MTDHSELPDPRIQHYSIGMSVEALASAWARRDHAEAGSVVVVESEIAGRRRLGEPCRPGLGSLAMAMILRPDLDLDDQGLIWLIGDLAAQRATAAISGLETMIAWPDSVVAPDVVEPVGFVNVVTQLGPGRIEFTVVSVRISLAGLGLADSQRAELLDRCISELKSADTLLRDERQQFIDIVVEDMLTIDARVKASLLPRGEARGRATALDPRGRLVLETPTGMLEYVTVDSVRSLEHL